jgi:hypothetical protein
MAQEMQSGSSKGHSTQSIIPLSEIREGVAILKDGTMRAIMMVSSINFALKSEDEQNAIIYAYQEFINALDFPVQISVSSRKMDITPYLEEVKVLRDKQTNELLRLQMTEYINFIGELVKGSNIMTKTFFITVPFSISQSKQEGAVSKIFKGASSAVGHHTMSDEEFEHNKAQLFQRVGQVSSGLRGLGLRVVPLQTEELLELFYNFYNPTTSRNQRLHDVGQLKIEETEGK